MIICTARFADWPFWVSEGLAMYFETPAFGSSRGCTCLRKVNRVRLVQMRKYVGRRGDDSLLTLISDDNFSNFLQRTILLQFALKPERIAAILR